MAFTDSLAGTRPLRTAASATERLGRYALLLVQATGELAVLGVGTVRSIVRDRQRKEVVIHQLHRIGYQSLPVVLVTGVAIGLVLGVQSYATLKKFNAGPMAGPLVNFSMITQLGPVLTGLMLAGRVGSNMAAEIGTMKVTEQIDALRVMGTDPVAYLVGPRFLACVLLTPLLTALGAGSGIVAGSVMVVNIYGIDSAAYWFQASEYVRTYDIATGIGKTVVFGGIIALVACRQGLQTAGGAAGVGESCTRGVVQASLLVMIANFLLTLIIQKLWVLVFSPG